MSAWQNQVSGVVLVVSQGITGGDSNAPWLVFKLKPNGSLTRRSIPKALDSVSATTKEEAQAELDAYAPAHGFEKACEQR